MTQETALIPYESQLLSKAQEVGIDLMPMLEKVPEAGEDAYVDIIRQIAQAEDISQLDKAWQLEGLNDYVDTWLTITDMRRMPSDFVEGLGFYLIVDATLNGNGKKVTVSTGSVNVCVQLLRAYTLSALPLIACPRKSVKPTRNGYWPMHLEIFHGNGAAS